MLTIERPGCNAMHETCEHDCIADFDLGSQLNFSSHVDVSDIPTDMLC